MNQTISVIIPVFNEAAYLPRLLDSLVHQSRPADEIIVCDNNSTDNSVEIAKSYMSRLPLMVMRERVQGIIPTVEKSWRSAAGDIIVKTDADAYYPPQYLQTVEAYFTSHPRAVAVTGPILNADRDWGISLLYIFGTLGNFLIRLIRGYPILLGPNSAFRRPILEHVDGYRSDRLALDDQLISKKIHDAKGGIAFVPAVQNYHSSRRWRGRPDVILHDFLSLFSAKQYVVRNR